MIASTLLSLLLPALVSAHGYVNKVVIDGTVYQGNSVGATATISSAIRQVNTNSPVKGATNPDLNCGAGAQLAADVANANPGSNVQVYWVGGTTGTSPVSDTPSSHVETCIQLSAVATQHGSDHALHGQVRRLLRHLQLEQCRVVQDFRARLRSWQHNLVPSTTRYGVCPLINAVLTRFAASGSPATTTIPSTLAAGNYLLRSEIIALQLAMTEGGAEFYPSCIQLSVGGSQTGQPTSSEEITLPGGYSDTDPGILTPNVSLLPNAFRPRH